MDGIHGKRTQAAYEAATAAQKAEGLPFQHPSGLTRVAIHWTGGGHKANATDRKAYHVLIEGDGTVIKAHDPQKTLAHTLRANTGAIGVSMCAMAGAVERPFKAGAHPLKSIQLASMARVVRLLCADYDIPISRYSVLTHAEVQPTLGIAQRQKWDVVWLPGMERPSDPISVGEKLRAQISRVIL